MLLSKEMLDKIEYYTVELSELDGKWAMRFVLRFKAWWRRGVRIAIASIPVEENGMTIQHTSTEATELSDQLREHMRSCSVSAQDEADAKLVADRLLQKIAQKR